MPNYVVIVRKVVIEQILIEADDEDCAAELEADTETISEQITDEEVVSVRHDCGNPSPYTGWCADCMPQGGSNAGLEAH